MTFMVSFGKWGGLYWHRDFGTRLCLGWVALTWLPADIDDWLAAATVELERLRGIEAACMSVYNSSETTRTEAAGFWLAVSQPGVAGVALGDVGHAIASALLEGKQ